MHTVEITLFDQNANYSYVSTPNIAFVDTFHGTVFFNLKKYAKR